MLPPGTLSALGLYLVRTSVMVLAAPLLGDGAIFSGYKVGLIGVLTLLLYATTGQPLSAPLTPIEFGAFAMREVLIGMSLAFVLQMALLGARVAGEMVGHEMAFNMASQVDPATGVNAAIVTRIYETMFLLGFLAVNGHHWMVRALSDSYQRAPVGMMLTGSHGASGLGHVARNLFEQMFRAGLTLAAPVMVLLFLVSLMIGLLARAVPQLNLLEAGFTMRILMGLTAMALFAPLLAPAMENLYAAVRNGLDDALYVMGS